MRPDLSIGAALPPAGRQRRGGGSPGAWRARAARATMRGWLVMTDSWAQFYRVLLMVVLDGTRPSEALEWVSPVAPAVTQAAVGAGHWAAGRRAPGPGSVGERCWVRAGGVGPGHRSAVPGRVESIWRQQGDLARKLRQGPGCRRDANTHGRPAIAARSPVWPCFRGHGGGPRGAVGPAQPAAADGARDRRRSPERRVLCSAGAPDRAAAQAEDGRRVSPGRSRIGSPAAGGIG